MDFIEKAKAYYNKVTNKTEIVRRQIAPEFIGMGSQVPDWLNVNGFGSHLFMYENVPECSFPIDYYALQASKIPFKVVRLNVAGEEKKEIKSGALIDFLQNPNCYQSFQEFMSDAMKKSLIFGNLPITRSTPAGYEIESKLSYDYWISGLNGLFNLPANRTQIKFQKKDQNAFFLTRDLSDIVEAYYYDQSVKFEAKDTVLLNDSNLEWKNNEWILGDSKIALLQKPLSTLLAAYEARYVILNKRGAIGIFTATSDSSGALPLLKKEKKNFQNQLSNYGLNRNQSQFMFTNKPLNYQSLAVHIKDMQVLEGHELDRRIVFDGFNFPKDLAAQDSGAKYENQKDAEKRAYTDGVFPYMKPIYTALNTLLQTKENGIKIVPNLDDIESLKSGY